MLPSRLALRRNRGFTLVEALIALAVMALALASLGYWMTETGNSIKDQATASFHGQVTDAASRYIKDNFATVAASATAAVPHVIPVATLRTAGYLPSSALDVNPFGQTVCVLVLQPVANKLETLVVTEGGTAIDDRRGPRIASMMGARGGFIDSGGATVRGTYGGWQRALAPFNAGTCSGTAVSAGGLAASLYFDNGQLLSAYLYRNQVPGYPEANTMHTAIDMTDNDIVAAKDVYAKRVLDVDDNAYFIDPAGTSVLSDTYVNVRSATVPVSSLLPKHVDLEQSIATHGDLIPMPVCYAGGSPHIYVIPAVVQVEPSSQSFRYAAQAVGAFWQIELTDGSGAIPLSASWALYRTSCYYP